LVLAWYGAVSGYRMYVPWKILITIPRLVCTSTSSVSVAYEHMMLNSGSNEAACWRDCRLAGDSRAVFDHVTIIPGDSVSVLLERTSHRVLLSVDLSCWHRGKS
jgi:hypothetical protein